ncbi:MAG: DUF1599 domain-containing protein [Bacteroidia bacterium]
MSKTLKQYDKVINNCRDIFLKKNQDYGTAWRILRTSSLTDQIFIKANRVRTIQKTGENKVGEAIENEFVGIINYCAMALIQLELADDERLELDSIEVIKLYDQVLAKTKLLMESKNHDYGEAWRDMRVSSLTDLILMKLLRVKQIEDNNGRTIISEGIDANYMDMINYSIFALILLSEN